MYCECRIHKSISDSLPVVDVDGSYRHQNHKQMIDAGVAVFLLGAPTSSRVMGWEVMKEANVKEIAKKAATSDLVIAYLSRLLTSVYNVFFSGRCCIQLVKRNAEFFDLLIDLLN